MQPFMLPADWPNLLLWTGVLAVAALIADRVASGLLQRVFGRVAARTRSSWDDRIAERKVVQRLAHVVPALVVYLGIGPALGVTPAGVEAAPGELLSTVWTIVRRVAAAYIAFAVVRAFAAFLDAVNDIYQESYAEAKSRPIKGYLQVVSLVAWLAAAVVIVSVLVGRSPVVFLSGLGALAAVLMLVFRDTILSLVASVQIASNDMIRIGDWLSVPQAQSDGEVIDIALHTIKVQNWDKTISTIPTSKFITESFKNWRGMSESGGRRIKRSLRLDMNSVRFLRDDEIEELSRRELLQGYMRDALDTIARYNAAKDAGDPGVIPEIRRLTNLGTFRVYVQKYLEAHPKTHKEMTLLARQLAPGPEGVPIEIYCFSNDTAWANYEGFQADIFDHLIAVLPEFGLKAYQSPAGSDFARVIAGGS
ncbi:MAG: mechanosensitive ion channel [Gemmatimonadetes bacterium]|nr:mechanosensitive ion channel [Gemmatimonadota bacterium]MYB07177.1 mechanosensitive ion channel [Gemmatimonadota bacterium]MYE17328.1 mechanosensitive ion channel [Gemmatimonadota bacterium]MYG21475.1 mechanosensitive ion channel [Gemmatimonadota bacterium]MYJ38083.1 mechanosensitive ion channel [Gemmatimonadota bacterium]